MSEAVEENFLTSDSTNLNDDKLHSAILLYEGKSYSKALNLLINSYEHDKTGSYANLIGNCYLKLGSINDAIQFWQKAISKNPTCYQAFLGLGNAYFSQSEIKQALIYWHIALSIEPENPQINYNLAIAYSRREERFQGMVYYERFMKYSQDTDSKEFKHVTKLVVEVRNKASNLLKKGAAAIAADDVNTAVQFYIKALKTYPLLPKVIQNVAKVFALDRNFKKAIEYYKMAYYVDDSLKICLVDIGNAYVSLKEYELAYCYFRRFLNSYKNQNKSFAEVEKIAAYTQSKIKEDYDTIKHLNVALELENNLKYREALDEYENYSILSGDDSERIQESIKKLNLMIHPERIIVKNLVSKIEEFEKNDKREQAIAFCDRIVVLSQLNSQIYQWASRKKQELRYAIFKAKEGKK